MFNKKKQEEKEPMNLTDSMELNIQEITTQEERRKRALAMAHERAKAAAAANEQAAKAQAQEKAQAEAQKKAQEQARAQTEAQARAQAQAQAQAQAAAQARAQAEAQARAQAQAQAQVAAQARAQAEEQVRAQAQAAQARDQEQARTQAQMAQAKPQGQGQQQNLSPAQVQAIQKARMEAAARAKQEAVRQARAKAAEEAKAKAVAQARAQAQGQSQPQAPVQGAQSQPQASVQGAQPQPQVPVQGAQPQVPVQGTQPQAQASMANNDLAMKMQQVRAKEQEALLLKQRAEELKRQAELAALENRMQQLEQEAAAARQEIARITGTAPIPTAQVQQQLHVNSTVTQNANGTTVQRNPLPVEQPKKKLSSEEIDAIFAKELENTQELSKIERKQRIERQAQRQKDLIKQKEIENQNTIQDKAGRVTGSIKDKTTGFIENIKESYYEKKINPKYDGYKENANRVIHNVIVIISCVVIAWVVSSLVTAFVAHPTKVEGESMEQTLSDGNTIIIQKMSYYFGDPSRYDVVVFPVPYQNSKTFYIKRVIGMPGETVQIKKGRVYINGNKLKDDRYGYKNELIDDPGDAAEPITLAKDEYFVMGDNRNFSTDSRSPYVGLVRRKNIEGKAWFRLLPFSKFGDVD